MAGAQGRHKTEFRVLGPLEVAADGGTFALGAPKQRAVLAMLALQANRLVTREQLVDAVWGERPPEAAKRSLQVYVHGLRRALGADRIETRGGGYRLRVEPGELDLHRFQELVERAQRSLAAGQPAQAAEAAGAALALWRGAPLADLAGEPVADLHGPPLAEQRLAALELHADAELACGGHAGLVPELEALVAEHPYRERLREQLILALYRSGRQKAALDAYRDARHRLSEDLGIEPGPALQELERSVLRHDPGLAAPGPVQRPPVSLPAPPTPLVGRRLEVAAVVALLDTGARLVTLTGPGGTGKTRLALAVAEELAPALAGGAVFVDLSPVTDAGLVAEAIAQAVGIGDAEVEPAQALEEHLRERPLLAVLDNLEQLLPDVASISELLSVAPKLLVLATSRAPLRLSGEREYPVPPLPVPPPGARFEAVAANDAVQLFLARAQAVDPSFALTDESAAAVAGICRRLDGLPLALELAAVRARILTAAEIERRLTAALDLLVEGARDLPARQRTLRATLDWSYELLDEAERSALARLSVFAAGATLEAAKAVLGDGDVLASVSALVENSLLRREDGRGGAPRLALLETVREYALQRLRQAGEETEYRRRHAEHFCALAERHAAQYAAGDADPALAELDREHENLLAAVAWAAGAGEVETQVRLVVALRTYWFIRGYLSEGRRLLEQAITGSAGDDRLHARALIHGAAFAFRRGDLVTARKECETALELFRALGDAEEAARCTSELAGVAMAEGDLARAETLYRETSAAFAAQGNRLSEIIALGNLAAIAAERGDYPAAEAGHERVIAIQREIGDQDGLGISLHNLARVKLFLGRVDEARALSAECLAIATRLGYRELLGYALGMAGELALLANDPDRAARLVACSDAIFAEIGIRRVGEELESYERTLERLRIELGEDRLLELEAAGAARPLEQVVAEATALVAGAP